MFEQSTTRLSRDIVVRSIEKSNTANIIFQYSLEQPSLRSALVEQAAKALDIEFDANITGLVLTAQVGDDSFSLTGDAQLRDALASTTSDDTFHLTVASRRKSIGSTMGKHIMVNCSLSLGDNKEVESNTFRYRFIASGSPTEDLLTSFKDECVDALDLFGSDANDFALQFKLDGEWIPIGGDKAIYEVMSALIEAGTPSIDVKLVQASPKAPAVNLTLRVIFEGTTRQNDKFEVETAPDAASASASASVAVEEAAAAPTQDAESNNNNSTAAAAAASSANDEEKPVVVPLLTRLINESKALWNLGEVEEVTLLEAVPATHFAESFICSTKAAKRVVDAAIASHEKTIYLRMQRGNVQPDNRKTFATHLHALYLDSETNKFEHEAEFDFSWSKGCRGAFATLAQKVRGLLHLTVQFDLYLGTDARGEIPPQRVKNDDQVMDFLANAPTEAQLFCIKSSMSEDSGGPLPVGRASFIRALVVDWKQIVPRSKPDQPTALITAEDMQPIITTWHLTWELKRRELILLQEFHEFAASANPSVPVDELFTVLMRWTAYLVDDEVADFSRHCQNMIDYVAEVSNETRCLRLSAKCFSALRSGNTVNSDLLIRALLASTTVSKEDAEQVVRGYEAEGIAAWELDEILTYFFLDDAAAYTKMLGAAGALRTTPDYSQHDTAMKAVREKRLRYELRHAFDGVVPAHLRKFAQDHFGLATVAGAGVPKNYQDLAWCVSTMLQHPSSSSSSSASSASPASGDVEKNNNTADSEESGEDASRMNSWKWLLGECSLESSAEDLFFNLRNIGMTFCDDDKLQEIGVTVFDDGLDARLLHAKAGSFFSNLAQWCYILQELAFLTRGLQIKVASPEDEAPAKIESAAEAKTDGGDEDNGEARDINAVVAEGDTAAAPAAAAVPEPSPQKSEEETETARSLRPTSGSNQRHRSPYKHTRYSPPRATVALRPAPPSAVVPRGNELSPRGRRLESTGLSTGASAFGLVSNVPKAELSELLKAQKEENLLREFASPTQQPGGAAAGSSSGISPSSPGSVGAASSTKAKNNAEYALFSIKGCAGLIKHPMLACVDSYVVGYDPSGAVVHQTPVIEGTCSPTFPTTSRFIIPLVSDRSVVFHILTESSISGFLGEVTYKLSDAMVGGTREVCLKVKPRRGETDELLVANSNNLGHLTFEVIPLKQPIYIPSEPGFIVAGHVDGAVNCGALQPGERRDLYVQIMDANGCPVKRTDANSREPVNPTWTGIGADFIVPLEQAEKLCFKLIDEDLKGGRIFGEGYLPASSLLTTDPQHQVALVPSITGTSLKDCSLNISARVLGPLPDDLAYRKRQEEAKRLAQARADELAEEQRKKESAAYEKMLEDQEYIRAAEREAERQQEQESEAARQRELVNEAKAQQERERQAQARAKQAALAAADEDADEAVSAQRRRKEEVAAAAEAAERERMATIDREMQRSIDDTEKKARIKAQLEEEEAAKRKHFEELENAEKKKAEDEAAQQEAAQLNENGEPKTQQEVAESAAKSELKHIIEEQEREEREKQATEEREKLEVEEAAMREALESEQTPFAQDTQAQMAAEEAKIRESVAVAVEKEPEVAPEPKTEEEKAAELKEEVENVDEL